jgi:urease accessory protein
VLLKDCEVEGQLTQVAVRQTHGRHRTSLATGLLRPQLVHSRPGWCRIGLVATTALLLGGDTVELQVEVGPGARLDLFDVAGTVAFNGRGAPACWRVRIILDERATLRMSAEPFIVADGADVTRSLALELAQGATALIRETVILGRAGERGGRVRASTRVRVEGQPACFEDLDLDASTTRTLPGMLSDFHVLDSILALGQPGPTAETDNSVATYSLAGEAGTLTRYLGRDLALSPLNQAWSINSA